VTDAPRKKSRKSYTTTLMGGPPQGLSFTHKCEHVEAIEGAKKAETRARRIATAVSAIAARPERKTRTVRKTAAGTRRAKRS